MAQPASSSDRPSRVERLLGLFSEVRPGEARTALLLTANLFLILVAYYIIKTVREPLVLATGGAELKTYAAGAQAAVLMFVVPAYGWLAHRLPRNRLVMAITVFSLVCLGLFDVGARLEVPMLGFVFYVWVGVFSVTIIAQFWSFANDVYDEPSGKRLFPLVGVGATVGAVCGSYGARWLFERGLAPTTLMHVAELLLGLHLLLYVWAFRRPEAEHEHEAKHDSLKDAVGGFELVLKKPYLRSIALLLILLNLVNTTGEYVLGASVLDSAEEAYRVALSTNAGLVHDTFTTSYIGAFYGGFFTWVNVAAVVMQAFLVSRLVKFAGLRGVLIALPLVALGGYALVAAGAGFAIFQIAKSAENATDYSVMSTARAMVWLPTTRAEKYKAKQAVDTFFVRFGDVLAAGVVFVGTTWAGLGIRGFAVANVVVALVWLALALRLARRYEALVPDTTHSTPAAAISADLA
ncbi:MAG: translocase [Deltaproteobacteria bacterium]|nr:translocase [Deltaproteobacteria bacterium]